MATTWWKISNLGLNFCVVVNPHMEKIKCHPQCSPRVQLY